eukprot:TRINITY_DN75480_c0_g1_i1.p1 TRINITY_DN75480_c0_g1~~TRINITY_DN75480_c0_g1_i1.p1  ORF type:complete len:213 (+),score=37.01 TRINITY_DN75480_c0_g1_i1:182-820(+)
MTQQGSSGGIQQQEGIFGGIGVITPFSKKIRPYYILLLVLEVILLVLRWLMGDPHGALLMLAVTAVGVLAVTVAGGGVDVIYGGYFGLMAFVSGLLDLNIAIEHVAWHEWGAGLMHHRKPRLDLMSLARPALYLLCAAVQLAAALLAYLLYKDVEALEDEYTDEPIFATQEQARVYHSIMAQAERRPAEGSDRNPLSPEEKAFSGKAYKLPA